MNKKMWINHLRHFLERGYCEPGYFYHDKKEPWSAELESAQRSQVILFDTEQVKVFWDLINRGKFAPSLDYRLPFPETWLQFSKNIVLHDIGTQAFPDQGESAVLLTQYGDANEMIAIHEEFDHQVIRWSGSDPDRYHTEDVYNTRLIEWRRLLAAACIQYINCENIYLEKQCDVPESVNRKRERKGKSRLEPYYVCRIRGVNYDSHATGDGSKHGIRYDVRGHFRRMETGKTIWVRPHQRGLQNELYVPKVYKVDQGAKQFP